MIMRSQSCDNVKVNEIWHTKIGFDSGGYLGISNSIDEKTRVNDISISKNITN